MITLDTGALIAIERRKLRMLRVLRAAEQTATPLVVPTVVIAEWWRGRPASRMRLFLSAVVREELDAALAEAAGEALGRVHDSTVVDAVVMASAARRGGVVYTSDVDDLMALQTHFPSVRILAT